MLTRTNIIKCDDCGKFVKLDDIAEGKAVHNLYTPDSDLTREIWESYCARCIEKNRKAA